LLDTLQLLLAGIEDLREKREEINKQIKEEESEKAKIQQDLQILTKRLSQINDSLARKVRHRVHGHHHAYSTSPAQADLT
jgi:uncharacterized coiled-coil protein SlyX